MLPLFMVKKIRLFSGVFWGGTEDAHSALLLVCHLPGLLPILLFVLKKKKNRIASPFLVVKNNALLAFFWGA
jgi:hypothetical protein